MTDLAPGAAATRSCPRCGQQNPVAATVCPACGTALTPSEERPNPGRDDDRGDIEVVEAARSLATVGYETEFPTDDDAVVCPFCGRRFDEPAVRLSVRATDTTSGSEAIDVVAVTCPTCHEHGHVLVPAPDR